MEELRWDIFISHASEDKETVAKPLASALRDAGARVWLDAHELKIGDSLSAKIDEGLAQSRFGAVIISAAFLSKYWPKKELSGLRAKEEEGGKTILPIWHGVDRSTVVRFSPTLADSLAANTADGIPAVAEKLLEVVFDPASRGPATTDPPVELRFRQLLESNPKAEEVATFLNFHLGKLKSSRVYDLPPGVVWKPLELKSLKFEAFAHYAGHGGSLMLIRLCELFADPFDPTSAVKPILAEPLRAALEHIDKLHAAFQADRAVQQLVKDAIFTGAGNPGYGGDPLPNLTFVVFAGRRSFIDANSDRQREWGYRRHGFAATVLKTYDALIDAFRSDRSE